MTRVDEFSEDVRAAITAARPLVIRAAWFSLAVNLLTLTGPLYMLQIYDRVLASRSGMTLFVLTVLAVGLYLALGLFDFVRSALVARAAARFDARLSLPAFNAAVDAARLSSARAGETPMRDLRAVRQTLGSNAVLAFFDAPFTPAFMALVFMAHWALGLLALVGAMGLGAMAVLNERSVRQSLTSALEANSTSEAMMSAILRNASTADAMGMRSGLRSQWQTSTMNSLTAAAEAADRISGYAAATKTGRMLLQSLLLGLGALLAIMQQMSPGAMIAASIIATRALAPIEQATGHWRQFGMAIASWKRLSQFLKAAPPQPDRIALPTPSGRLKVDKAVVQPIGAKKPILKGVTVEALPGEALGVIGPSGAGKSTLARVMVGVERVVSGDVRLDGADLLAWPREEVGRHIGYLPQETDLLEGTVGQNIARFDSAAKDEQIINAASAAGAMQLILSLPDGFETQIGERGSRLSAGQRQRICLARALYGNPALIVLDEPNSNLDAEGEAALSNAILAAKTRGASVVIVAHRPSAITHVDKLLLVVDGEVRAYGPRVEVLNKIAPGQVAAIDRSRRARDADSGDGKQRSEV